MMDHGHEYEACMDCGNITKVEWLTEGLCHDCKFDIDHEEWLHDQVRRHTAD